MARCEGRQNRQRPARAAECPRRRHGLRARAGLSLSAQFPQPLGPAAVSAGRNQGPRLLSPTATTRPSRPPSATGTRSRSDAPLKAQLAAEPTEGLRQTTEQLKPFRRIRTTPRRGGRLCPPGRLHRFYGNLRRIRNFPAGRCGHRPLQRNREPLANSPQILMQMQHLPAGGQGVRPYVETGTCLRIRRKFP